MTLSIAAIIVFMIFTVIAFAVDHYVSKAVGRDRKDQIANRWFIGLIVTAVLLAMIGLMIYTLG